MLYWCNRFIGFSGFFDMSIKKLKTAKIDSADQIRRTREMNSRDAFNFLRRDGSIHPEAVSLAVKKLELNQVEMLLASKPGQEISISLQVRLQELKRRENT